MKNKLRVLFIVTSLLVSGRVTRASTITWTNTIGGNWNVAANWSPNQVPGGGDSAVFSTPGTYTASVTDTESVSNLFLGAASGTLTLNILGGTFTVNGNGSDSAHSALVISGGTVTGSGSIVAGGPLTWTGGNINGMLSANGGSINVSASSTVGNGGELINTGPLTWTPSSGPRTGGGTVISNAPGGVINVALNGNNIDSYVYGGAAAFYNAGTINVSGSGQSGSITDPFFNTGTLNVNSGTLSLSDGGTNSNGIVVAAGATLAVAVGTYNFSSGSTITGAGTNNFSSGTVNFLGDGTVTGVSWLLSGANVNLNGSGSISPAMLILNNGLLAGSDPLLVAGPLTWTGGNINGMVSANGGSINVSASSTVGNGGELINTGPLTWTPNSGPRTGGGTVISNAPSGVINVALNGNNIDSYVYGGAAAFYNAGTINVTGSGQSGSITDPFFNTGTLNVNGGILSLAGGGLNSGTINAASGADLDFAGGTFTSTAASLITGAGNLSNSGGGGPYNFAGPLNLGGSWTFGSGATVNLTGSTTTSGNTINLSGSIVNFNGTGKGGLWQPGAVNLSNGTLGGSTPVVIAGPLTWTGGNINGMVSANGGSINVSASSTVGNGGELINTGPLTWTPSSGPRTGGGTVISNAPGGVINVALNGNNIDSYVYGGAAAFYNAGTINVSGSGQSGSITDPFFNTGTLNVNSGTLSLSDGGTNSNGIVVAAGATLAVAVGTYNFSSGSTITGAGTNNFSSGTVNFLGDGTVTGVSWLLSGANVNLNGSGSISPAMLILNNGLLAGSDPLLVAGPLTWTGGNINGMLSANGGSINVSASSTVGNGGELINTGPLTWTPSSGPRTGGGTVISNAPSGVINVALNGNNIDSYVYGGAAAFYNAGTINVTGSGQSGSITDPFFNTGTLNVNGGTLSILVAFSPSNGTLNFGINSATNFGQLTVSGLFAINGTLRVTANGYTPHVGDSFPLITYGSKTGGFTSFNLLSGINWQQTYGSTVYTLSVGLPLNFALAVGQPPWSASGFNLAISGPVGSNYTVFVTTNLAQNNWLALSNFVSVFTTTPVTDTGATKSDTNRFYRLYLH